MKRLLLLIDLQTGWRHETASEPAMLRSVALAKRFHGDVIHCKFRNDPNGPFHAILRWTRFTGSRDTDDIPEMTALRVQEYWRSTYSCITPELLPVIHHYDRIYIAGVFTDISVAATAMHIFDLGLPVCVVRDCVATLHGEDVHMAALKSLEYAIGPSNVLPADEVLKQA